MRLLPDGFDAVDELYTDDQLGQLVVSVEAAPTVLCPLGELEDHGERRLVGEASLDVPVSVIADIDILNDERTFRNLFENLGGNWDEAKLHWKAISDHVVNQRPPRSAEQVANLIAREIEGVAGLAKFPKEREHVIKRIFKDASAWSAMKGSGRSALSHGEPIKHFDRLCEKCSDHRLWIVSRTRFPWTQNWLNRSVQGGPEHDRQF